MNQRFGLVVCVLFLPLVIACESETSLTDLAVSPDQGLDAAIPDAEAPDAQTPDTATPLPKQSCTNNWVSTHLTGPETALSYSMESPPGETDLLPSLRLAGGRRGLDDGSRLVEPPGLVLAYLSSTDAGTRLRLKERGIHVVEHVHDHYFILALEKGARPKAGAIRAMNALLPADKLPPDVPDWLRKETGRVALFADATGRKWKRTFAQLKLPLTRQGELAAAKLGWVYRVGTQCMVGGSTDAQVLKATRAEEVQGFSLNNSAPSYSGYTGEGIIVTVMDRGVDKDHHDLFALDASGQLLGTRVTGAPPLEDHSMGFQGTGVASILAGNGFNSTSFSHLGQQGSPFEFRGHAPRVEKIISVYLGMDNLKNAIAEQGSQLSNHSHQLTIWNYDDQVRTVDEMIHDGVTQNGVTFPPRPVIWCTGNNGLSYWAPFFGYYSLTAQAKNIITVGGSNANDNSFNPWSGLGPSYDGRIKPDLVAPASTDFRPPGGIIAEIDEIRLKAKAGSGASDLIWSFDTDDDSEGWKPVSGVVNLKVADGLLQALVTGGGEGGTAVLNQVLAIDGDKYDQLEVEQRLVVNAVPGKYLWPDRLVVQWGLNYQEIIFKTIETTQQNSSWHTYTFDLPASTFTGTITNLAVGVLYPQPGLVVARAGTQTYKVSGGTCYSAPAVSGIVALLLEQFHKEKGTDLVKAPPWPSTLKALLIQTARDLIHATADPRDRNNPDTFSPTLYYEGPDFATGYGLVDAKAASDLLSADVPSSSRKLVEETLSAQEVHTYRVPVSSSVSFSELRATLVWDDAPGNPVLDIDEAQLVNDLDLVAISPSGKAHGPWLLDPLPLDKTTYKTGFDPIKKSDVKPAYRCVEDAAWQKPACEDHRNNVEQVVVAQPETGWWTIKVRAYKVPVGPQRYTLVVAGACE